MKKRLHSFLTNISYRKKTILYTSALLYAFILLFGILVTTHIVSLSSAQARYNVTTSVERLNDTLLSRLNEYNLIPSTILIDLSFQEKVEDRPPNYPDFVSCDEEISNYMYSLCSNKIYRPKWHIYLTEGSSSVTCAYISSLEKVYDTAWLSALEEYGYNRILWGLEKTPPGEDGSCQFVCCTAIQNRETRYKCGYLYLSVNIQCLEKAIMSAIDESMGIVYLLNNAGEIMWSSDRPDSESLYQMDLYQKGEKTDRNVLINDLSSNKYGYHLVCITPMQKVSMTFLSASRFLLLIVAAVIIAAWLGIAFSSRLVGRRIMRLTESIKNIDENTLEFHEEIYGFDEAGELCRAFSLMFSRMRNLIDMQHALEQEKYKLQFDALQSQINPHFLYNTLSIINHLALEIEADNISTAINALADYYRMSLNNGEEFATLESELRLLESYFTICSMRYHGKFTLKKEIDPDTMGRIIPRLIIQPLIENAVFHGFSGDKGAEPIILLEAKTESDTLRITIQDNGRGMTEDQIHSALQDGFALSNIDKRLRLLYGEGSGLRIASLPHTGTTVTITIVYSDPADGIGQPG